MPTQAGKPPRRTILSVVGLVFLVVLGLAQVIRPLHSNPRVDPSRTLEVQIHVATAAEAVLRSACRNCHTSSVGWRWYSA